MRHGCRAIKLSTRYIQTAYYFSDGKAQIFRIKKEIRGKSGWKIVLKKFDLKWKNKKTNRWLKIEDWLTWTGERIKPLDWVMVQMAPTTTKFVERQWYVCVSLCLCCLCVLSLILLDQLPSNILYACGRTKARQCMAWFAQSYGRYVYYAIYCYSPTTILLSLKSFGYMGNNNEKISHFICQIKFLICATSWLYIFME